MIVDFYNKYKSEMEELTSACHRAADLGYVASAGGNLSARVGEDVMLITPTKTPKRLMKPEYICVVDMQGNTIYAPEGKKPTGEVPFHLELFRLRDDIKAIVHAHPPVLTGFAVAGMDYLRRAVLPEPVLEIGPILMVKYAEPLTHELSNNFREAAAYSNGFLMENHGAVMCSPVSVFEAMECIQMAEEMAKSILVAHQLGHVGTLSKNDVKNLDNTRRNRGLRMPCADGVFKSCEEQYLFDQ